MPTLPTGPDRWENQPIMFCGHDGYFMGDVVVTPFAVVVSARNTPVNGDTLQRKNLKAAKWHIRDDKGGYWNGRVGTFLLPRAAVTKLV
jgi:hypothetical protein